MVSKIDGKIMTSSFDVLSRKMVVQQDWLLEASAGTGKTFSIENIVVRLLVEEGIKGESSPELEDILVVTFTRAATQELQQRIREKMLHALACLKEFSEHEEVPDYLRMIMEKGDSMVDKTVRCLERALAAYDQAQVFTIHSFCYRMLCMHGFTANVEMPLAEESLTPTYALSVIKDFFRTEVTQEQYSVQQLKIVLAKHQYDSDSLARTLARDVGLGLNVAFSPSFSESFKAFVKGMQAIKKKYQPSSAALLADFVARAPAYVKTCNRQGEVLPTLLEKTRRFVELFDRDAWTFEDFDQLIAEGVVLVSALAVENLKKGTSLNDTQVQLCGDFVDAVETILCPIIDEARNYGAIYGRMVVGCQALFKEVTQKKDVFGFKDLLEMMWQALDNVPFLEAIRKQYRYVIIDEFQDTDPLQWKIFQRLFLEERTNGKLYLVGDPKQSIYAFRNADVYTYLAAASFFADDKRASLRTNYRSQRPLVEALNLLFSSEVCPGLITLPRSQQEIPVLEVDVGNVIPSKEFHDSKACVKFFVGEGRLGRSKHWPTEDVEDEQLFPFIAYEIDRLTTHDNIALQRCAILVRDHYQEKRLASFLRERGIPSLVRRNVSLMDSEAVKAWREVIVAILDPFNISAIKVALGSRFIAWTHAQIKQFQEHWDDNPLHCEEVMAKFIKFKELLGRKGFAACYHALMQSQWHDDNLCVEERLLRRKDGRDFYADMVHVAELIVEYQNRTRLSADGLLLFFSELKQRHIDGDERIMVRRDIGKGAVNIVTLHASKGLEWDVVFALGLANRTPMREELIRVVGSDGKEQLKGFVDKQSTDYQKACEEIDAEKMRQLYVAMTRAKLRLYVPVVIDNDHSNVSMGTASPMELFLARLGQKKANYKDLLNRISEDHSQQLFQWIDTHRHTRSIDYTMITKEKCAIGKLLQEQPSPLLCPPPKVIVPGECHTIQSFSALARKSEFYSSEGSPSVTVPESIDALPLGVETGHMVHKIFEAIQWEKISTLREASDVSGLIDDEVIQGTLEGWKDEVYQMVFNVLTTSLFKDGDAFSLSDVTADKLYREMEFLFADKKTGYLRGFIDLIIEHQKKFYIVDWKTNWIGQNNEDYNQRNMEKVMNHHNYFLQAAIYAKALKQYLHVVEKRPFQECFGGAFYLFTRGMSPKNQAPHGIFHFFPDLDLAEHMIKSD